MLGTAGWLDGRSQNAARAVGQRLLEVHGVLCVDPPPTTTATTQAISDFSGQMEFDPEANTDAFIAALDAYKAHSLDAVTINLQGGLADRAWCEDYWNSAWTPEGELDPAYAARLARVLDALSDRQMGGIVGLFYFRQDQHLVDDQAVDAAIENAIEFLEPWKGRIIVEVVNEANHRLWDHPLVQLDQVATLVEWGRTEGYHTTVSLVPGALPPTDVVRLPA